MRREYTARAEENLKTICCKPSKHNGLRPMAEAADTGYRRRKLAAILHADMVGFSRLMERDEAGTHRLLGELRHALDPLIAQHAGRIVGTAGDSLLADFSSVVDALQCAVAMQEATHAVNQPLPPERIAMR